MSVLFVKMSLIFWYVFVTLNPKFLSFFKRLCVICFVPCNCNVGSCGILIGRFPQALYFLIMWEPAAQTPQGATGAKHPKMCKKKEELRTRYRLALHIDLISSHQSPVVVLLMKRLYSKLVAKPGFKPWSVWLQNVLPAMLQCFPW